jgi:hypothetical protein
MGSPKHLFSLIYNIFYGFSLSAGYGAVSASCLWLIRPSPDVTRYLEAYFVTFNGAVTCGLVFATAITVLRTQMYVSTVIETTFSKRELESTDYYERREDFLNLRKTLTFSSIFAVIAFAIFYAARFPFDGLPEHFLIAAGCLKYALGVYVGRKIFHIAHMLRAIAQIRVSKDLFSRNRLGGIPVYINVVSTMTVLMVYLVVISDYRSPYVYDTVLGTSVRTVMLLPAIISIPVLAIFNYYPRIVVREIYERSISRTLRTIRRNLESDNLSEYEKVAHLLEFDRVSRDDLNYRLRMTLADLPMAATIGVAVLSAIMS